MSGGAELFALIVDQDTATGLLLTGVGQVDIRKRANFLIVDDSEWFHNNIFWQRGTEQPEVRRCCRRRHISHASCRTPWPCRDVAAAG